MFKKLRGKSVLINHYKLIIVSSERSEHFQNNIFKPLKIDKIPATTQILLAQIMKFPDFSLTFLIFKISLTNLQNSRIFFGCPKEKEKKINISDFSLTSGHPV